jgi:ribosomal protein S18 acetylase RimI-like enzyme
MLRFDTLSLIVSRANQPALRLYQAVGLQAVLAFPVFVWEQS